MNMVSEVWYVRQLQWHRNAAQMTENGLSVAGSVHRSAGGALDSKWHMVGANVSVTRVRGSRRDGRSMFTSLLRLEYGCGRWQIVVRQSQWGDQPCAVISEGTVKHLTLYSVREQEPRAQRMQARASATSSAECWEVEALSLWIPPYKRFSQYMFFINQKQTGHRMLTAPAGGWDILPEC